MIRLTADQTYRIIYYILEHNKFTQTEINKATKTSIGRVNQVVSWLVGKGYVSKIKGKYRLTSPVSLINLFSTFRSMDEIKIASLDINATREEALEFLTKERAVFCLTSALQYYDSYFRDPAICVYVEEKTASELKKSPQGNLRINLYRPDLSLKENIELRKSVRLTSPIRTIIDLFCDNKAYTADRLIKRAFK